MIKLYEMMTMDNLIFESDTYYVYKSDEVNILFASDVLYFFATIAHPTCWESFSFNRYPYFEKPDRFIWFSAISYWPKENFDPGSFGIVSKNTDNMQIYLFGNLLNGGDPFSYLGNLSITGRGSRPSIPGYWTFTSVLEPRLSQEQWWRFGGYSGWLLQLGEMTEVVHVCDHAVALINSHWGKSTFEFWLTRYEGDILHGVTNKDGMAFVSYLRDSKSAELFSGNYDPNQKFIWFELDKSDETEVPITSIISRDAAIEIVQQFFATGFPKGVQSGGP